MIFVVISGVSPFEKGYKKTAVRVLVKVE